MAARLRVGHLTSAIGNIAQSRGRDLLNDVLGKDFGGVLLSDCLATYDDATALQHKCYAHHHKANPRSQSPSPSTGQGLLMRSGGNVAPPSLSKSRKLCLSWKPSLICVKPWNTKPFNYWGLPAANLTKKPCANGSRNNAIISLPF
jgi:hypothetical protein